MVSLSPDHLLEATCYAYWHDFDDKKGGFGWRTTVDLDHADVATAGIIKKVQAMLQTFDSRAVLDDKTWPAIWLQGELAEGVIYAGRITRDEDEYQRPSHRKEIWMMGRPEWQKLGACTALLWHRPKWFTSIKKNDQGKVFLQNASAIKNAPLPGVWKPRQSMTFTRPPDWLAGLLFELVQARNRNILLVAEASVHTITRVLATLPISLRLEYRSFVVGWHKSLLKVINEVNIVFCDPVEVKEAVRSLEPYGARLIQKNYQAEAKIVKIVKGMYPESVAEREQFTQSMDLEDLEILFPQESRSETKVVMDDVAPAIPSSKNQQQKLPTQQNAGQSAAVGTRRSHPERKKLLKRIKTIGILMIAAFITGWLVKSAIEKPYQKSLEIYQQELINLEARLQEKETRIQELEIQIRQIEKRLNELERK